MRNIDKCITNILKAFTVVLYWAKLALHRIKNLSCSLLKMLKISEVQDSALTQVLQDSHIMQNGKLASDLHRSIVNNQCHGLKFTGNW
jgi:hypothetical protein